MDHSERKGKVFVLYIRHVLVRMVLVDAKGTFNQAVISSYLLTMVDDGSIEMNPKVPLSEPRTTTEFAVKTRKANIVTRHSLTFTKNGYRHSRSCY